MKNQITKLILLAILMLFGTAVVGCSPTSNSPQELNMLIFEGYAEPEWVEPFEKEYNVKINITEASSVDEMFSKMSADNGKGFDLVTIDTSLFKRYVDHKLIVPIELKNIPNYYTDLLPEFRDLPVTIIDEQVYGIPYAWGSMPLIYNTDVVQGKPDSWSVMWDEEYKGKVIILDEPQNSVVIMALYLGGFNDLWNFSDSDFERLKEGFKSLAPQLRTISAGATDEVDLLANREVVVGIGWAETTAKQAKDKGVNIAMTVPKESSIGWIDNWNISAGVRNKELAEKWLNWVISKENSAMMAEKMGYNVCSNTTEGVDYAGRLTWIQPRGDYERLSKFWNETKLMLGQTK